MTRYVVIGGSGFVGQWLVKALLEQGKDVLVDDIVAFPQDISGFKYKNIDIRDRESLSELGLNPSDVVIHLAANQYHLKPPKKNRKEYFFGTNYEGTKNILDAMHEAGCHNLIYFSTDMVYGKPDYIPVKSDHPKRPFGYYGASKWASEQLCDSYRQKGINITIFRPRMIVGPGRLGVLTKLFRLMDMGLPVPLIGDGSNCYQMVSVFDVVDAISLAIEKGIPNKAYNLGSVNPPSVYNLLSSLIENIGSKSILVKTPGKMVKLALGTLGLFGIEVLYKEQYEIADINYLVDTSEAGKDLGWKPNHTDKTMLFQAYQQYKQCD